MMTTPCLPHVKLSKRSRAIGYWPHLLNRGRNREQFEEGRKADSARRGHHRASHILFMRHSRPNQANDFPQSKQLKMESGHTHALSSLSLGDFQNSETAGPANRGAH